MMKRASLFLFAIFFCCTTVAQIKYETFKSRKLNATRHLKIQLPKNYDPESSVKHPVIIVFDGDYLFEPVVGQVSYQTYFNEMPESIIVGIEESNYRFYDTYYDEVTGLPREFGAKFFEFIGMELLPYIDDKYNTSKFRVAIGHDMMGNFINSFLLKEKPIFQAYINISPDFKGSMNQNIVNRLKTIDNDVFYYMATSENDVVPIKKIIIQTDQELKAVDNKHLTYYFDEFKGDTHYTMVNAALSKSLDKIFDLFKPLDEKEIEEKVMTYEGTLDDYIEKRTKRIEDLFGIQKPITEAEFESLAKIAEEKNDDESLEGLGKLANKQNPSSSLGTYYMALNADKKGKTKKAVKLYESALELKETTLIKKDSIMARVEQLKFVAEELPEEEK